MNPHMFIPEAMTRLETAERRFSSAVKAVESELLRAAQKRNEAQKGLDLVERIEGRAENALKKLRDLIRQSDGGTHG